MPDSQVIKQAKDAALRCMNAIRFQKMGKPIAPVWPKCPNCGRLCSQSNDLLVVSKVGVCSNCTGATP